eukprot:c20786_g1_i1 orf=238-1185(+)
MHSSLCTEIVRLKNKLMQTKDAHSSITSFVAGGCAGVVSTAALQPFDVIKTHIQAPHSSSPPRFGEVVRSILQRDGIRGLWRGTAPACLRVGIGAGFYFTLLGPVLSRMSSGSVGRSSTEHLRDKLPLSVTLSAGALTRSLAALLVCPITVVKTRMEYEAVSGLHYHSTANAIISIASKEGVRGLYSGLLPTILRDAPYSGLYLLMYNRVRYNITDWQSLEGAPQFLVSFLSGAVAGAGATLLTHPPDVIRTRLQLESREHLGFYSTVQNVIQRHGVAGLFAGVLPRAVRRALHQAISWAIFEQIMNSTLRRHLL